jgi:hypothetical protein
MADWLLTWKKPILGVAVAFLVVAGFFGAAFLLIDHRDISTTWELRGVSEDGRTVTIAYGRYPCESLERVEKSETASAVTLKVILRRPDAGCEGGVFKTTDVELTRALGARELFGEASTSWDLRGVSEDGGTLTIGYRRSSCESFKGVEKSEAAAKVALTVVLRQRTDVDCDRWEEEVMTEVALPRPLGSRKLVDGETGQERALWRYGSVISPGDRP